MFGLKSKALITVFRWQAVATVLLALLGWLIAGLHGAISALLGGATSMVAGVAAGLLLQRRKTKIAGDMVVMAITAEAARIGLMLASLGLIFATYKMVVPGSLIAAFIVTVLIFSMAFFVRDN
ncbi:MAG: ATP synthase subunit I [Burkholderiales bacterium]